MVLRKRLILLVTLVGLVLWLPAGARAAEVEAEGYGVIYPGDSGTINARNEAIRDALSSAIRKGLGVTVTAESKNEDFELVREVVLVESRGRVTDFEIIEENPDHDLGYRVFIRAQVTDEGTSRGCADQVKMFLNLMGDPRFAILAFDSTKRLRGSADFIVDELTYKMHAAGYHMVDAAMAARAADRAVLENALQGDVVELSSRARDAGADYIILINLDARESGRSSGTFPLVIARCRVFTQLIMAETGEILNTWQTPEIKDEASSFEQAVAEATEKIARILVPKVVCETPTVMDPIHVEIRARNIAAGSADALQDMIASHRDVENVAVHSIDQGEVRYRVRLRGLVRDLVRGLDATPQLEVVSQTVGSVEVYVRE